MQYKDNAFLTKIYKSCDVKSIIYIYNIGKSSAYYIYTLITSVKARALVLYRNYSLYKNVIANNIIYYYITMYIYKYIAL